MLSSETDLSTALARRGTRWQLVKFAVPCRTFGRVARGTFAPRRATAVHHRMGTELTPPVMDAGLGDRATAALGGACSFST
jgi:hypothetical protein